MNLTQETEEIAYKECLENGICPDCGAKLIDIDGCFRCFECGWSACDS